MMSDISNVVPCYNHLTNVYRPPQYQQMHYQQSVHTQPPLSNQPHTQLQQPQPMPQICPQTIEHTGLASSSSMERQYLYGYPSAVGYHKTQAPQTQYLEPVEVFASWPAHPSSHFPSYQYQAHQFHSQTYQQIPHPTYQTALQHQNQSNGQQITGHLDCQLQQAPNQPEMAGVTAWHNEDSLSGVDTSDRSPTIATVSDVSSPDTSASSPESKYNSCTVKKRSPVPRMSPQSRPAQRSPYGWMKKPSYQSQPNPEYSIAVNPNVGSTALHDLCTLDALGKTRTKDKYRVVYSDHQRLELEKEFHFSRYITIRRKTELAGSLALSERQVKIWFQNRRAKERKQTKKREELEQKELAALAEAATLQNGGALANFAALNNMSGMVAGLMHNSQTLTLPLAYGHHAANFQQPQRYVPQPMLYPAHPFMHQHMHQRMQQQHAQPSAQPVQQTTMQQTARRQIQEHTHQQLVHQQPAQMNAPRYVQPHVRQYTQLHAQHTVQQQPVQQPMQQHVQRQGGQHAQRPVQPHAQHQKHQTTYQQRMFQGTYYNEPHHPTHPYVIGS